MPGRHATRFEVDEAPVLVLRDTEIGLEREVYHAVLPPIVQRATALVRQMNARITPFERHQQPVRVVDERPVGPSQGAVPRGARERPPVHPRLPLRHLPEGAVTAHQVHVEQ